MKRKTRKKPMIGAEESSLFFMIFAGEFIEITTTEKTVLTNQNEDGTIESGEYPLGVKGFLLDEDENFLFIGKTESEVSDAIAKSHIFTVSLIGPNESKMQELAPPIKNLGELN